MKESKEIKIDAAVDVLVGSKTATKKVTLKKGADPIKFPEFTAELSTQGVKVIGKFTLIKSISIMRDGKEKVSNGFSSSGDQKTYMLEGIKDGDEVIAGNRFGLIRFGSRTELFVPADTKIVVKAGDHVVGSETIIGQLTSKEINSNTEEITN